MTKHPLPGSERQPVAGAKAIGAVDPTERLEVTVLLRRNNVGELADRVRKISHRDGPRQHLSREQFEKEFGADAADLSAVRDFASRHGLAVVQAHAGRRTVVLSGTVAQFSEAFGVDLQRYEHGGGSYRGRVGSIHLPDELTGRVQAVLGLDNRPVAKPHFRSRPAPGSAQPHAGGNATSFTPPQLAKLYGFPNGTGHGECVAIIELGGGERPADLTAYFTALGITTKPKVVSVSVDHARNHPTGDANGPDGEVMLDIEVVGAIAPQANIAVYFAPNTDAGFLDAITTAIHDTKNNPSVISISWGGPESSWTPQSLNAFDAAFQAAAAIGITVCAASGDNGSSDGVAGGDHVDFPASSPHVLACGGTSVRASGNQISSETVWNNGQQGGASGGGVSTAFPLPAWQDNLQVATSGGKEALAKRGVPDVAGDADPQTGWHVRVDGTDTVIGGTSAVAPMWAGLIALINEANNGRPVGFINPLLYASPSVMNDIEQGNNGTFQAAAGWDACTGLGSPNGSKVAALLTTSTATS